MIMDGHDIVRLGLENLVVGCPGIRLVGSTATLGGGLRLIRERTPDLVMTDLALRDCQGLDTIRAVAGAQRPRYSLIVSALDEMFYGEPALALGASGYVMKHTAQTDLLPAALTVLAGQAWISPALNARLINQVLGRQGKDETGSVIPLTRRELEVLEHLKCGKSTKQIAGALSVSPRTVDVHRSNIKKKLGLRTGAEVIAYASQHL